MTDYKAEEMERIVRKSWSRMIEKYDLSLTNVNNGIDLRAPNVLLSLDFGRYTLDDYSYDLEVGNERPFLTFYLLLLRNGFKIKRIYSSPWDNKQVNFERGLLVDQENLMPGCDDLLRGDATTLVERDRYFDFKKFMLQFFALSADSKEKKLDAKAQKNGDFTFLKEPWERFKRGQQPFGEKVDLG